MITLQYKYPWIRFTVKQHLRFKKNIRVLELIAYETNKLLGSTENNIYKDKNDENMQNLEINEVILIHCNAFENNN